MSSDSAADNEFAVMAATYWDADIQQMLAAVKAIVGSDLPTDVRAVFLRFHKLITKPAPRFLTVWKADPRDAWRAAKLTNGILADVQNCVGAALYHLRRIKKLESEVSAAVLESGALKKLGGSTIGGGNSIKLSAEYHAFVQAYRRSLEYLTGAASALLGNKSHSFRKIPKSWENVRNQRLADALIAIRQDYETPMAFVLTDGPQKSVRDRVAHFEFVSGGTFNVSQRGLTWVGGGEELAADWGNPHPLSDALAPKFDLLVACIDRFVAAFEGAVADDAHAPIV